MDLRLIPLKMLTKVLGPIFALLILFSILDVVLKQNLSSENEKLPKLGLMEVLQKLPRALENDKKFANFIRKEEAEKPKIVHKSVLKDLNLKDKFLRYSRTDFWEAVGNLENNDELYPKDFDVELVQQRLRSSAIVEVKAGPRGTSFKWTIVLEGNQQVVFKPQLVPPRTEKKTSCNVGHEQPRYEVAIFYLMRLFGSRAVPYVAGRKINITKEVLPYADETVKSSIHTYTNGTVCLIHKCHCCPSVEEYCFPDGIVQGSLVYWLKRHIRSKRGSPDSGYHLFHTLCHNSSFRSYGLNDHRHCDFVRSDAFYKQDRYFLDMVDISIMGYLFAHEDERHVYTVDEKKYPGLTVHLDHGRAFCDKEYMSSDLKLAPIYQCCRIRTSTVKGLRSVQKTLTQDFARVSSKDVLYPLLEDSQLGDVARRITRVMEKVSQCQTVVDDSMLFDSFH